MTAQPCNWPSSCIVQVQHEQHVLKGCGRSPHLHLQPDGLASDAATQLGVQPCGQLQGELQLVVQPLQGPQLLKP